MNILILAGGMSNERDVSLRSGDSVAAALQQAGHSIKMFDPNKDQDFSEITKDIDVVFIALHGEGGEDGEIQAKLEKLQIPFVGSDSKSSKLCFDKMAYKQLLTSKNLPVATGKTVTENDINSKLFNKPYVLKPVSGGSSLDTQIVRNPDAATLHAANNLLKKYPEMLYEELVEGVEITVGILDNKALPVIEIIPPSGGEFDYENKYNGKTQELCPPENVSQPKQQEAKVLAEKIHELCDCRHMSRTDMIIDPDGNIHVLETNTIPGLTEQSLLPKMAQQAGMNMSELTDKLVRLATST